MKTLSDNISWKINREKREIDSYMPSLRTSSLTKIILPYRPHQDNAAYHKIRDLKPFRSPNKKFLEKLFVDNTFDCLEKHIQILQLKLNDDSADPPGLAACYLSP